MVDLPEGKAWPRASGTYPAKPLPPENHIIWSSLFGDRDMGLCCRDCDKLKPYDNWRPLRRWWSRDRLCWCLAPSSRMEMAAPYPYRRPKPGPR